MEMLRQNLKRQTTRSCSISPLSVASPADDQENLHPNLAAAPPSPANKPSTPPPTGPSKPVPGAAAAAVPVPQPAAAAPAQQRPGDDEPAVKVWQVVVRVRPAVSLPVDGKDLFFMRKISADSVAVGDRAFAVAEEQVEKLQFEELLRGKQAAAVSASENVTELEASIGELAGKSTELCAEKGELQKQLGEMSATAHSVNALKAEAEGNFHDYKKSTEIWRQEMKEKLGEKSKELDSLISQEDVFHMAGMPMIHNALAGFNTSLVCYGQSGTGKTYTMWGGPRRHVRQPLRVHRPGVRASLLPEPLLSNPRPLSPNSPSPVLEMMQVILLSVLIFVCT